MTNSNFTNIKKLIVTGICLAGCMLLPFLSGQIPEIGKMLAPMHLPVLICGFVCGWKYGFALGAIAPILRFFIFGMPVLFPVGTAMSFELAAYGICTGILYVLLPKKNAYIYINLLISMVVGRLVWGAVMTVIAGVSNVSFSLEIFVTSAVLTAIPAVIIQLIIVPLCVMAFKRAGYLSE